MNRCIDLELRSVLKSAFAAWLSFERDVLRYLVNSRLRAAYDQPSIKLSAKVIMNGRIGR
jgi:hypothetical protein